MTTSTDGQICFGILFDEGYKFPWDDPENSDSDIESWWIDGVHKYESPFRLYDDEGNYIDGIKPTQDKIDQYYTHRREFIKSTPSLPVTLVNYCSGEYPMYILALEETVIIASRGYPQVFLPLDLKVTGQQIMALKAFCKRFGIEYDNPQWWLSSYWG